MLEASDLCCVRGDRSLFSGISFNLAGGALLQVTGTNGSGKTSLLRIVCGLSTPEAGTLRWHGNNIKTLREEYARELVYIGHVNAVKDDLTALENLHLSSVLAGLEVTPALAHTALERFGVAACAALPARVLSQGQRRRVALARLVLCEARPLWVLDEPFAALDSHAVSLLQSLLAAQLARGGAVLFTTHQDVPIAASTRLSVHLDA